MDTKKCGESRQLPKEGFLSEHRVEPKDMTETQSTSSTSTEERNSVKEYDQDLLEQIVEAENWEKAYQQVKSNRGSSGVDHMTLDELPMYLQEQEDTIRISLLDGTYRPKPVRRVEIPKPDGGTRLLGIPTVLDRVIQQAITQIIQPRFEQEFSDFSYGFRPNRNAHQAVLQSKVFIEAGYTWVVDIDLEKYFDTVNHDKLIRLVSNRTGDGRVVSLIRKYLKSGVMVNGVVLGVTEGTPQGGNISPLLSNIMLHELDQELTKRGLHFCRYADDCNIYLKSEKAANRVMASITQFIEQKLKLKINPVKSSVTRPWKLKFLGFSFLTVMKQDQSGVRILIHPKSVAKLKRKLKVLTGRSKGISMSVRRYQLKQAITGWMNYFCLAEMKWLLEKLDQWLRRRIRMCYWKQWKKIRTKHDNLMKLGIRDGKAWEHANTRKSYWRISGSPILSSSLTNSVLLKLGFPTLVESYSKALILLNRRIPNGTYGGVRGR
jgi:group II intron reverse transcriptase/maturase